MITIEIDDYKHPGNPWDCSRPKPQVEVFLDGFKQLCNKTRMNNITTYKLIYNGGGKIPIALKFDDGTSIGISRLFEESGFKFK